MNEWTKSQIQEEFNGFLPELDYCGGCKKTHCPRFCVQLKPDGKIGHIFENCKTYDICNGYESKYRI